MDDIERLLSEADPAKSEDIGGPGPLTLQDPVPVFSQTLRPAKHRGSARGWGIAAAAMAIGAVATGVIMWSPWSNPDIPRPAVPMTPPSPSASIDIPTAPRIDHGLPNFLVPAHQDVYFEDAPECDTLDLRTLTFTDANGERTKMPDNPKAYPVVGCVDGFAAIMASDLAFVDGDYPDGSTGVFIARWEDGSWGIDQAVNPGIQDPFGLQVMSWPALRGRGDPANPPGNSGQDSRFESMGLDEKRAEKLLGPNVPSWMGPKAATEFNDYGNTMLSIRYPAEWEMREFLVDGEGNILDDPMKIEPADAAGYDLLFFDLRGKQVFSMMSSEKVSNDEATKCLEPESTYVLEGESPSGVIAETGPMKLAMMTTTEAGGALDSTVGLLPGDTPSSGRLCDVQHDVVVNGRAFSSSRWIRPMGFKNQAERDAYVKSPEYMDAMEVAEGLSFAATE